MIVYDNSSGDIKVVRRLKGKHLEAAYRVSERARIVPWLRQTTGYKDGPPTFMGFLLLVPPGSAMPSDRKRGRPKKLRDR